MTDLLIIYKHNWADEMDIEGSRLMSQLEWSNMVRKWFNGFEKNSSQEFSVGTNESIEYNSFDYLMKRFDVAPLPELSSEIWQIVNMACVGHFPNDSDFQHWDEDLDFDLDDTTDYEQRDIDWETFVRQHPSKFLV